MPKLSFRFAHTHSKIPLVAIAEYFGLHRHTVAKVARELKSDLSDMNDAFALIIELWKRYRSSR